jgi:hypothetical protein
MNFKMLAACSAGIILLAFAFAAQSILTSTNPELWCQQNAYLTTPGALVESKKLVDRALAAGYTGIRFWDSGPDRVGDPTWNPENVVRMRDLLHYAQSRGLKTMSDVAPFGWSNNVLAFDPNWAEAQRVVGTTFRVSANTASLELVNSSAGLANGDFEAGHSAWFDLGDPDVRIDAKAHRGKGALTITNPRGNARVRQKFPVKPWRQYHLSFFYKAEGVNIANTQVAVYDANNLKKFRFQVDLRGSPQWADLQYVFNSGNSTELVLYAGVWGGAKGVIQFDDFQIEETAFVWLEHRAGAPFRLYDPKDSAQSFVVGTDYNEVVDPGMAAKRPIFSDTYHRPPVLTLPKTTPLKPGQIVAADYYAVTPLAHENQVGICLTEPAVYRWLNKNAQALRSVLPSGSNLVFVYDEIRHANSCFACRSKNVSAGDLVAESFKKTYAIYHSALPNSPTWVWNDVFDPYHNARGDVYYVEGTMAGSWKALPPGVSILNWNLDRLKESLTWFSGIHPDQPVPHAQVIAGFYDRPDAAGEVRREIRQAYGIPGVRGVMYTSWVNDYSKMKEFASAARAAWPDYAASLPRK